MEEWPVCEKRLRFTIREILLVMVIMALALGWYRSSREASAASRRQMQRLMGLSNQHLVGSRRVESERD
jgi:hypothetical protein